MVIDSDEVERGAKPEKLSGSTGIIWNFFEGFLSRKGKREEESNIIKKLAEE